MIRIHETLLLVVLPVSIFGAWCASLSYAACDTGCTEAFFFRDTGSPKKYWKVTRVEDPNDPDATMCNRTYYANSTLPGGFVDEAFPGYKKQLSNTAGCSGVCLSATTESWKEDCTSGVTGSEVEISCYRECAD